MIKIDKNLIDVPSSLLPAFPDLFPERIGTKLVPIPQKSSTTHARRLDVIAARFYTDNDNFNSRYKQDDIREILKVIYRGKCAFCEQNEEVVHIEHYRPKAKYYWLAYSWDNLLLACPSCNVNKGSNFELYGPAVAFVDTEENLRNINVSSANYDLTEAPKMVNPETTDPLGHIRFTREGTILSDDPRFSYTIETCKIDRKALNDSRRSLLDRFREHIRDAFIENTTLNDQLVALSTNIRNFITDSKNENEEFLAFRKYAIDNNWLNEISKEQN